MGHEKDIDFLFADTNRFVAAFKR